MSTDITVTINLGTVATAIDKGLALLNDSTPMMDAVAQALESQTEANFDAQGRPAWLPLAKSTIAARKRRGSSVLHMLVDSGILRRSVTSDHGPDFAMIGANTPYAAIQQLGGTVQKQDRPVNVRLRETAKGALVRQRGHPNLAVFGKEGDKRVRTVAAVISAHSVNIPARPYLPFSPTTGQLQPEAEADVLSTVTRYLRSAMEP